MKKFSKFYYAGSVFCLLILSVFLTTAGESQPVFYMATDKSFGTDEIPYINLEGPGDNKYEFRIYKIDDPVKFIKKSVKERLVKEQNDISYGNPVAIFKKSLQQFKKDFRNVARKEFNYKTRSHIKNSLGIDYNKPYESINAAIPGLLNDYPLVSSFSISGGKSGWDYKRISVPASDNGVYLVEGVSSSNISYTIVVKSNINFATKQSDKQTLLYAAYRDIGEPIAGAKVSVINGNNENDVFTGTTSKDGTFKADRKSFTKSIIIVRHNNEFAISDPNFYSRSFYGAGGYRAFVYTDRPIYKPGDKVFFKGIIRKFYGDRYSQVQGAGTAQVVDAQGKSVLSNILFSISGPASTLDGSFTLPNDGNINLGVYNILLEYQGQSFATEFSVEAYKKPEFLVKVNTEKKTYIGNESIDVSISARYYYGEPVGEGSVGYKVFRKKKYDESPVGQVPFFDIDPGYLGMDEANVKRELVLEKNEKLSSDGEISFSINPEDIDDDYTYTIIASVQALNNTISGSTSFSVNRSQFYIKIVKESTVYTPGETVKVFTELKPFDLTLKDSEKSGIIANKNIKAILYSRSFTNISSEAERKTVDSQTIKTDKSGKGSVSFKIPSNGHYIIECMAEDNSGQETTSTTTFWASAKSDSIQIPFKNITLKSQKDIYSIGDYAEILMMTPAADGTFFVTIEANGILKYETIKIKGNTYKYKVKINESMSPNFTLSVLQFAANDIYQSQIKIISPPHNRFLNVKVQPARRMYKPGEDAVINISTIDSRNRGVSAEVSVAVVDEAIYQLQEDKNPPITTYFYHPRRNNVSTSLSTAYRFFGYSEAKRLKLALAGKTVLPLAAIKDEDLSRENYRDTCYWTARVMTNSSGKASIKVPLADNITSWRVTAIAVTGDTKVGQGENKFIARKDLMLLAGIPSYMLKGQKQKVSANVTNLTAKSLQTDVSITASNLDVSGKTVQQVNIGPKETKQVYFTVQPVKDMTGDTCSIDLKAKSGSLFDGVKHTIPARHFGVQKTESSIAKIEGDSSKKIKLKMPEKFEDARLEVRISPGIGEALRQSLAYLISYPYGCIEQTMSRFMPILAAKKAGYTDANINQQLSGLVSRGLSSIQSHQKEDGGFGWYGENETNAMMTAYVYRGLALCKKLYNQTNNRMMVDAQKYLYNYIRRKNPDAFQRAYILFSLSEGTNIAKSMIDKLTSTKGEQNAYGKVLISHILYNSNMKSEAEDMFESALDESGFKNKSNIRFVSNKDNWREDNVELASLLLGAAVKLKQDEDIINNLSALLIMNRNGIAWKNSRDTSFAVIALSEQLQHIRENTDDAMITVSLNDKKIREFTASASDIEQNNSIIVMKGDEIKQSNEVGVVKKGGIDIYATALIHYVDNSDSFNSESRGFEVSRTYYKMEGKEGAGGKYNFSSSKTANFSLGDLVMAEVDVSLDSSSYTYCMIEDAVPPGFSVVRKDTNYFSSDRQKEYSSIQIFDDRVACFLPNTRTNKDKYTIRYFLRANIPGEYKVVPAKASLMYYPEIYGISSDDTVTIGE